MIMKEVCNMYNIKKQIYNELSEPNLPSGLTTIAELRSAQMVFNEISKNGFCVTVLSNIKDYYEKNGADIKTTENGWKITYETAEKKQKYFNLLQEVYKDGDVESFERESLKQLQFHLGLSDSEVNRIEKDFNKKIKEKEKKNEPKVEVKRKKKVPRCRECCQERTI